MNAAPLYTIAQYAAVLGIGSRAARKAFGGCVRAALREKQINGRAVHACPVAALPLAVRQRLADKAKQARYRDADDLLSHATEQWQPEIPLGELDPAHVEKAARLREVLAPVLRANADAASLSDLTRDAQAAFVRARSYALKDDRSVRRWIERAVERDRGRGEWERIELYLDDRLARRQATPGRAALLLGMEVLGEAVGLLQNPLHATLEDRENIWCAAMEEIQRRVEAGASERAARGDVLDALQKSGVPLACNRTALQRSLERKWQQWTAAGGRAEALKDRRASASGNHRKPTLDDGRKKKAAARIIACGGRRAQAFRELWDEGELPPSFYHSYTRNPADKSRVPKVFADAFPTGSIGELLKQHLGPKEAKLHGPKCTRDWSGMPSGVQAQSDDCTLPVYFWIQLEDGSFKVLRGQFLPWIDTRTSYIYCFQLLPSEQYGQLDVVRGLVHFHDTYGLVEELYFENGLWKNSLMIAGRRDEVAWKDRVYGLRDLGIRLSHASGPSAKVVERVLGALQNQMERERGYCGRDERRDCPEAVKRAKQAVESGKCHPREFFYSYAEWVERLTQICNGYNDEPQAGKMLEGLTPRQAFVKFRAAPPIRLDETTRYFLACHRRELKVTANGLTIKIGNTPYTYKSEATGRLIGQKVLAWFDVEDPEVITLTDLEHRNPVSVARETLVPAYNAPIRAINKATRENAAHMAPHRRLYSTLRKEFPEEIARTSARPVMATDATRALGAEMDRQKAVLKTDAARKERTQRAVRESARRAGLALPATNDLQRLEAQNRLAALMQSTDENPDLATP